MRKTSNLQAITYREKGLHKDAIRPDSSQTLSSVDDPGPGIDTGPQYGECAPPSEPTQVIVADGGDCDGTNPLWLWDDDVGTEDNNQISMPSAGTSSGQIVQWPLLQMPTGGSFEDFQGGEVSILPGCTEFKDSVWFGNITIEGDYGSFPTVYSPVNQFGWVQLPTYWSGPVGYLLTIASSGNGNFDDCSSYSCVSYSSNQLGGWGGMRIDFQSFSTKTWTQHGTSNYVTGGQLQYFDSTKNTGEYPNMINSAPFDEWVWVEYDSWDSVWGQRRYFRTGISGNKIPFVVRVTKTASGQTKTLRIGNLLLEQASSTSGILYAGFYRGSGSRNPTGTLVTDVRPAHQWSALSIYMTVLVEHGLDPSDVEYPEEDYSSEIEIKLIRMDGFADGSVRYIPPVSVSEYLEVRFDGIIAVATSYDIDGDDIVPTVTLDEETVVTARVRTA